MIKWRKGEFICKFQYKIKNDPFIYCSYFKGKVECGCVGNEDKCKLNPSLKNQIKKWKDKKWLL